MEFHASSAISENALCIQQGRRALRNLTSEELFYLHETLIQLPDGNLLHLSDKAWFHYNLFSITSQEEKEWGITLEIQGKNSPSTAV